MTQSDMVKCAQLDLICELKRICDRHGLGWFLAGGSLIGAVRHEGFIPWDDDVDCGMLRADYQKFIALCDAGELDPAYELRDWRRDPESPNPFLKLCIRGTHYREKIMADAEVNDEICIDIFPYDNAPDSPRERSLQASRSAFFKKMLLLRAGYQIDEGKRGAKKAAYAALKAMARTRSLDRWKEMFERTALYYNRRQTHDLVSLAGAYSYKKELKRREMVTTLMDHPFETIMAKIPVFYDEWLTQNYGNYMQLPPESEQKGRHEISLIDLGSYQIRSTLAHPEKEE